MDDHVCRWLDKRNSQPAKTNIAKRKRLKKVINFFAERLFVLLFLLFVFF